MTARFELSRISAWYFGLFLLLTGLFPVGASAGITPATHDFGVRYVLGDPASIEFTIDNFGSAPLAVMSTVLTGAEAGDYSVVRHTCQDPIPVGGSCTVEVAFVPHSTGVRTAQLEVATDDSVNPLLTSSLVGSGIMQRYLLSLSILGDGSGTVHSSPGTDIACSSGTCADQYDKGTTVTLTPSIAPDSLFAGWSGCSSVISGVCTVSISGAKYLTASFVRDRSLLNYRWEGRGPDGGVVNDLGVSPAFGSDNTIFAGTAGGVFKSVDRGSTWTAVNTGLSGLDVRGVAVSPAYASDMTLFAATAAGLFASNNAGASWISSGTGIAGLDLSSLAISPGFASDRTVFAGTNSGVYRSTDAGSTWVQSSTGLPNQNVRAVVVSPAYATDNTLLAATSGGVFASNNGGASWLALGSALSSVNVSAISLSPGFATDGIVYAGTDSGGIYRFDIGSGEWVPVTPAGNSQPVMSLAVSPGYSADRTVVAGTRSGAYISIDAGSSWTLREVVNWGSRSFGAVALSPQYGVDRTIYLGSQGGGVQFSGDGGAFWFNRSSGLTAVQVRSLAYSPDYANDRTAFATALGGIFRTVDRGDNWTSVSSGIDYTDVRALAVSPSYPVDRTLFAGSDGGVYRSSDSGSNWTKVKAGIAVSAVALSPAYATDRTVYAATPAAEVYRSLDNGGSWEPVNSGIEGRIIHNLAFTSNGVLFAATDSGVYRLDGTVWQPVTAGKVTGGDGTVRALAASPDFAADGTMYAGTYGFGVLVTMDGGVTWSAANTDLANPDVQSLSLAPDFPTSRTLFAATAGGGLFRSTSAGARWASYNNELLNHDILAVAVSPAYAMDRQVFAGTNGSGISRLITTEPQIVVTPSAINFGTVAFSGTSGNRTITLGNTGQVDIRVSSISLAGANSHDFSLKPGSCPTVFPFTLLPGETCTVSASFDPRTATGARTATVTVESDSTAQPLITLSLSGTAYDPPPFGTIAINSNAVVTVTPGVTLGLNALDNSGIVASMRFSNDNAAWSDWFMYAGTFPWVLSTIGGDGQKTVYVQYMDGAGNISESFQSSIVLDSTPPITTITSMPATSYNYASGIFEFVSSKPESTFTCQIGAEPAVACMSPFSFTAPGDGAYTIAIIATDPVGNIGPASTYNWTIDTLPPDTTMDITPPALVNSTLAVFAFSATEPAVIFQCRFDAGPWAPCPSSYTLTDVPDGSHTLGVKARDAAGNSDPTPAVFSWTVDTAPPVTTITGKPANPTNAVSGSITFAANEPASNYDCTLDGVEAPGCSSPFALAALAEGNHTFTVRSRDMAGNSETVPASYSWRVDLTPPTTSIAVKPPVLTNQNSATFTFASTEAGSTYECSLDAAPFAACTTPLTLSALGEGLHHLAARAVDPAGNPDTVTAQYDWTVDTIAPDTSITSAPPDPSAAIASTFALNATEPGSTFQCSMDNGAWGACDSGVNYIALPNGSHTFRARAVDAAGNIDQTPVTYSWTVNVVTSQSVKVIGTGQPAALYSAINEALSLYPVATNPLVMLKTVEFLDDVVVNRCGETVALNGGYDDTFALRSGMTPLYGSITAVCGTLIVDGIEIR